MVNLGPFDRDNLSSVLLPEPWSEGYYAAKSTGNGNCLFNSCSIALCGDESLAASLRHAVSEELQNNPSRYSQDHPLIQKVVQKQGDAVTLFQTVLWNTDDEFHVTLDNIADLIKTEGLRTREDKRWSTILHVMALSTILGRTIQSLYPDIPWNYRELYHSDISPAGEQSFFSPQICDASSTPIVLLWTRDGDLSQTDHMFTANHVVPIFETKIMPDVEIISDSRTKKTQTKIDSNLGNGHESSKGHHESVEKTMQCQNVMCKIQLSSTFLFCPKCGQKINSLPVDEGVTGQSGTRTGEIEVHLEESGAGEGATGGLGLSADWTAPEQVNLENTKGCVTHLEAEPVLVTRELAIQTKEYRSATLACIVVNMQPTLSLKWYGPKGSLISVNDTLSTKDTRMSLLQPHPDTWYIRINGLQTQDSGFYKCVLNTDPEQVKNVHLHVQVDNIARRNHLREKCELILGDESQDEEKRREVAELFVDKKKDEAVGGFRMLHLRMQLPVDDEEDGAVGGLSASHPKTLRQINDKGCVTHLEAKPELVTTELAIKKEEYSSATLACIVVNMQPTLSLKWYSPKGSLISVNDRLSTKDNRMSLLQPHPDTWCIRINGLQMQDSGSYKCVLNTDPEQVKYVDLHVQVDKRARRFHLREKCELFLGDESQWEQKCLEVAELFVDRRYDDRVDHTIRHRAKPLHLIGNREDVNDLKFDTTVAENELMDEKKVKFVVDALNKKMGFQRLISTLYGKENDDWKSTSIKIALTGKSGCGKSSLINALRGLKSDDKGAAPIGTTETTSQIKEYIHPTNSQLILCDLPGAGTELFPKETYLQTVRFAEYDFIILLSDTRFTDIDVWLAKTINERFPNANLFFVRTKVDSDIRSINKSRRHPLSGTEKQKELACIANVSEQQLIKAGIKDPQIFLINNNNPESLDFGKLVDMLIKTVSAIKREALVLTNIILTSDAIKAKIDYLNGHIKLDSAAAAVAAVSSNRVDNQFLELNALQSKLIEYQRQLGIDRESVECIALALNRDSGTIIEELNSESDQCLSNFEEFYKKHDTVEFSSWFSLPLIGRSLKIWSYQRQCSRVLKELLQKCINDTVKLRKSITIWKR